MVTKLSSAGFEDAVKNGLCVVDFSAVWCGPCKMMAPVFDELSEEMEGISFYNVDVDDCPDIAQKFLITGVPTLIVLKDGSEVGKQVGFLPKEALLGFLNQYK